VTTAYRASFFSSKDTSGVGIASARAGNVIGGGDWARDRLVPDIIAALAAGRTAEIRNPEAVRPWQHVLEPLSGYLTLGESLYHDPIEFSGSWNFGPSDADARTVRWVASRLCEAWGEDAQWQPTGGEHLHEANHLKLDCSKAHSQLRWFPRLSLESALDWTVGWYRQYQPGEGMMQTTLDQINRYQDRSGQ
jgi:CDP-glucose 4,6-dehydratase